MPILASLLATPLVELLKNKLFMAKQSPESKVKSVAYLIQDFTVDDIALCPIYKA
jgi:hypothetical protein